MAEEFRKGARKVLFSSDVSARGVDYPDVTMVVQVPAVALWHHRTRPGHASSCGLML